MRKKFEPIDVSDVFVAGNYPAHTYNPRSGTHLESEITSYLRQRGKCLVISGPSKSGKTVLVEHMLPRSFAVWISGNRLRTIEDVWSAIVDQLDAYTEVSRSESEGSGVALEGSVTVGIPEFLQAKVGARPTFDKNEAIAGRHVRSAASTVLEYLAHTPVPIVIDDFHYIEDEGLRKQVTLVVKELILATHVILIAVPHVAFDPVRDSPDMNGRVWGVRVEPWEVQELAEIAVDGFRVLNLIDADGLGNKLAEASLGAPFIMQQLCQDLVWANNIYESNLSTLPLSPPSSWPVFFRTVADRHVPGIFEKLKQGPPTRGQERVNRPLKDGRRTDSYGAILLGVKSLSPRLEYHYTVLSKELEKFFSEVPKNQQLTSALGHMAEIARKGRGTSDAAFAYKDDRVNVADPFLAFYLQYGSWTLPGPDA
ncbi:ATP-binding protein [Agromyces aurantiacus]|uniref:ATP-binding protein n=1 Tax=Agromyces aurantiacus TaxID=165814 RepID=A0ABV9R3Z3_9MICO|nr:ATP-binding protein [Agromyces aurantiacus]MBM7503511.1 hypothetical protein [Agromyces aurantiacus]